jgi:serine/threonine protein kinase
MFLNGLPGALTGSGLVRVERQPLHRTSQADPPAMGASYRCIGPPRGHRWSTTQASGQPREKHADGALVGDPVTVGRRTALLLEYAGEPTLAEELQAHGRLSLDLLERYGRDLLDVLAFLDGQGVTHRHIKPANLATRPRPKDKQPHRCIFDFSLAAAPTEQIGAGTPPYLDPFLGPPRRPRFDLAAERFAAAVTLYEMATGTLPRWGDGIANPCFGWRTQRRPPEPLPGSERHGNAERPASPYARGPVIEWTISQAHLNTTFS